MATVIVNGEIFEQTEAGTVIVNGQVFEDTTSGGGEPAPDPELAIFEHHYRMMQ